ncbi:ANTAR domain-containing protein [Pseudarthrobacter sp. RMG13]|uniref:ANTAR domain-containing protein n=1 Tax=Pseudarthrobacter humi TaxID=2952523 RepID=A0ABT1LLT8_9MICC|nr:ANTAR domain-containing protein [Pseudarthrobacter humi]MCP8999415.1 ANTAR domain-containing protein [Pseudarthrobacter humi]
MPVPAGSEASIVLTVCVDRPDAFDNGDILAAEEFAMEASRILRPALRIAELKDTLQNLHAALEHRSVIDTALGVVMAQNHCDHDAAFKILMRAASTRNVKLRDIAATVLDSLSGEPLRAL